MKMKLKFLPTFVAIAISCSEQQANAAKSLGSLVSRDHGVSGEVFILSDSALEIRNFTYDGAAPDTFFWIDTSPTPSAGGKILADGVPSNSCGTNPLKLRANGELTWRVELLTGQSIQDYLGGSISVWCRTFDANFGEVKIPTTLAGLQDPGPALQCSKGAADPPLFLGSLEERDHNVAGDVYFLSDQALEIRKFSYDGAAPDTFFWADTSKIPTDRGYILLDGGDDGSCGTEPLTKQADGTMTYRVEFPPGKTIKDILGGSISVWCRTFAANFGELAIPSTLSGIPSNGPELDCSTSSSGTSLGIIPTLDHGVTGEVVVISDKIIEIRGFKFDGAPPDTYFWADTKAIPTVGGFILGDVSPTTSCGKTPLDAATGETYRIEFPPGKSIKDILGGSISVWCRQFSANFGAVVVPLNLVVEETPDDNLVCSSGLGIEITPPGYNCEPLNDDFQVRWKVNDNFINIELIGRIEDMQYLAFGLSGNTTKTLMDGGDPVVVDIYNGEPRARDFYLIARAQCSNGNGVCPDTENTDLTDDVTDVSGERDDDAGLTLVRYTKPLKPSDSDVIISTKTVDIDFNVNSGVKTFVIWAIGPISPDTSFSNFHSVAYPREDVSIEFGRTVVDNCEPFTTNAGTTLPPIEPFERPMIQGVTEFYANIGPSGEEKGYSGITGRVSWGIAWYLNNWLIPVIELERGTEYTFLVNGGNDPDSGAQYHPFYITTSKSGGYAQLTPKERTEETVLAGITITETTADGVTGYEVEAVGPLCSYQYTDATEAALLLSYEEFFATLDISCAEKEKPFAGVLKFTPDENTPDTIYYHCVTHRNLGWEIKVVDGVGPVRSFFRRILRFLRSLFDRS